MARERILITVKTYPTLSRKYGETVCTACVREDGSWVEPGVGVGGEVAEMLEL
jgi:hypothetical protein